MKILIVGITALFLMITSIGSSAEAPYCNLRNPSKQIYSMFPNASEYRSIVREVDDNVRRTLASNIPFQLHPNEVGEHTLYIPTKDGNALGIVHVRSEMIDWGMAEFVWGFDVDMKVVDVRFQRCRGRACRTLREKGYSASLIGKSSAEFTAMLQPNIFAEQAISLRLDEFEIPLARALLRSAIKTIEVTRIAWPNTVNELQSK